MTKRARMPRQRYRPFFDRHAPLGWLATLAVGLAAAAPPAPPETRVEPVVDVLHGTEVHDPYRWLEDGRSPETRQWIKAQNERTEQYLARVPYRDAIRRRLTELMKLESRGLPVARGERLFFAKRAAEQDLYVLCMRAGKQGADEVLVDPFHLAPDGSLSVSFLDISDDGELVAYALRKGGEDELEIRLLDVATGRERPDRLPRARYFGIALLPDKSGFYYTRHDKEGPRVLYHALATGTNGNQAEDPVLFGERYGPGEIVAAELSEDGRYLVLTVFFGSAADKTEVYLLDRAKGGEIRTIVNDLPARFQGGIAGDRLVLHTNWRAPNGRILIVDPERPEVAQWREIVAERKEPIEGVWRVAGRLLVHYLVDARSRVEEFSLAGAPLGKLDSGDSRTIGSVAGRWDQPDFYYDQTSFLEPTTIRRRVAATGAEEIWARAEVPFSADEYTARQAWLTSRDKTRLPMFLVHRRDLPRDGKRPTLLTGYGGFNLSLTPRFSPAAALWVEQGGVYAVPSLRGGGEYGEAWHDAGRRDKKQNVFDDFLAAARWLIDEKVTSPSHLAISGRSNGGLLVGAAVTQAPDLFAAAVCGYPLLDMLRYHQFLVARFWVPEYGSAEKADEFRTLLAYSPYHRVRAAHRYPAMLFVTGDADTRVDPLHARKMTARMQATRPENPVLLRYDERAGHSSGRPITQTIADLADETAFLWSRLGVEPSFPSKADRAISPNRDQAAKLNSLFAAEWQHGLEVEPTLATHLGDKRFNDRWPDESLAAIAREFEHKRDVLEQLDEIDPKALSEADQLNFRLFRQRYERQVEGEKYRQYLLPLDQRGGIQTIDELADSISFDGVKDYEDWTRRLEALPVYIDQTIELLREGIRTKRVHPKVIMKRIGDQIDKQIVADPAASPLFRPFEKFPASVPDAERTRLTDRAKAAIAGGAVPGYRRLRALFDNEYYPACTERVGIWQFPDGAEMYAFLARQFTTTAMTPDEIHKLGQEEVARIRREMDQIIRRVRFEGSYAEFLKHLRTGPQFYYSSGPELLEGYRALSKRIDPTLVKLFRRLPRLPYGVEPIPTAIAPDTTTAYYRGPAADGSRAGTFFVNLFRPESRPKYEMEALSLHEAVPGHHLQIALAIELGELPEFRRHGGYTAFVEGWGLYAESLGDELGFYGDPYSKFGQLTYEMWRAVRLVVDTGMHHLAWSREDAIAFFLGNAAKSELDVTNEIDRYIAWPGQALAYKIGELKIKELRRRATQDLGARFDIRTFHDVVLGSGAVPLDVLEANVDRWIEHGGKKEIDP